VQLFDGRFKTDRVLLYLPHGKLLSQGASLCPRAVMVLNVDMDSETDSANYD